MDFVLPALVVALLLVAVLCLLALRRIERAVLDLAVEATRTNAVLERRLNVDAVSAPD